jgi:hypothetical protein
MNSAFDLRKLLASCLWMLFICSPCFGALALTGPNHSEDFNFLASTGANNAWIDDQAAPESTSGSPGWWWFGENISGYNANSGTVGTPEDRMSYGDDGDRALGSLTGGFNDFTVWSLVIQNTLAAPITNISVSFTGEKWRDGDVSSNTVTFSYKISSSAADFNAIGDFGTTAVPASWTANSDLNFTGTNIVPGAVAVDGDLAQNQFPRSDSWAVDVPAGSFIALRWHDSNFSGADHGLAIDDLAISVIAIPEPSALLFGGLVCGVVGLKYARRRLIRKSTSAAM